MMTTLPEDDIVDMVAVDAAVNGFRIVNLTPTEWQLVDSLKRDQSPKVPHDDGGNDVAL